MKIQPTFALVSYGRHTRVFVDGRDIGRGVVAVTYSHDVRKGGNGDPFLELAIDLNGFTWEGMTFEEFLSDACETAKERQRLSEMLDDENEPKEPVYERLCGWIDEHADYMRGVDLKSGKPCYGLIENGVAVITVAAFRNFCSDNGYSVNAILRHLAENGLIECDGVSLTRNCTLGGSQIARCVFLKLPDAAPTDASGEKGSATQ